jgi:hypothetical protein
MIKGLAQFVTFLVFLLLMGATSWAADPNATPRTAPVPAPTLKPVLLKPAVTTPGGSLVSKSKRPLSFVEIATYPGGRPIRVTAKGLPSVNISNIRAFREGGGLATGIDMKLGQGPRGQQIIEIIVRANAIAGRYGMEFFANGKWTALQGGIMGLTVVAPQSGLNPLGVITGLVDARRGLGGAPGLAGGIQGTPGSRTNPKDVGTSFGLPGVTAQTKPGLSSGSRRLGDSRLMEDSGTTDGASPPADPASDGADNGGDTVGVIIDCTDKSNSDGTQDVSQTIITTDSKGNVMVDTMTAHIDANGKSTESQVVTLTDKNGKVIAQSRSTGSSTPDPEKAGCGSDQNCLNAMKWANQILSAITRKMMDTFYMAKIGSLGGDRAADDPSSGGRPGGAIKSGEGLPERRNYAVDPKQEKSGGSSESSPIGPLSPTTPTKDLKGTLPDPIEGGTVQKAGPTLAPTSNPGSPSTSGGGEVGGTSPYPSMKK